MGAIAIKELCMDIKNTIEDYLQVFKDCTNEDIIEALKQVMGEYK